MQRPVALTGFTPGRTDVFWCTMDQSSIMQTWFDGTKWQTATIARGDGPFGLAPAIYSDQPGKMDIGWTDRAGRLWYMRSDGSRWTAPAELIPSAMTPVNGPAPLSFGAGSPLVACADRSRRRPGNTEFLICDTKLRLWSLWSDGSTWFAEASEISRIPFPAAQIKSATGTISESPWLLWVGLDLMLKVSAREIPFSFTAGDFPEGPEAALESIRQRVPTLSGILNTGKAQYAEQCRAEGRPFDWIGFMDRCLGLALREFLSSPFVRPETREFARMLSSGTSAAPPDQNERRLKRQILEDAADGRIRRLTDLAAYGPPVLAGPAAIERNLPAGQCVDVLWLEQSDVFGRTLYNSRWANGAWTISRVRDHQENADLVAPAPVSSGGSLHVLWRNENGEINDSFDGSGAWVTTRVASGSPGDSPPAGSFDETQSRTQAVWVGIDGNLRMASRGAADAAWTAPQMIAMGLRWPAPTAYAGVYPPTVQDATAARMDVFYRDAGGMLKRASGDGAAWWTDTIDAGPLGGDTSSIGPAPDGSSSWMAFWTGANGALRYRASDGSQAQTKVLVNPIASPVTWTPPKPQPIPNALNLPDWPVDGTLHWVNGANQLCEMNTSTPGWTESVVGFVQDPDRGRGFQTGTVPLFSTKFAPAPLLMKRSLVPDLGATYSQADVWRRLDNVATDLQLILCDVDMNLWRVYRGDHRESYRFPKNLRLGPVAFAPVALLAYSSPGWPDWDPDYVLVFWCHRDDMSLRFSLLDSSDYALSAVIDPGPTATPPAVLFTPQGEICVFWGAQDGSLRVSSVRMRNGYDLPNISPQVYGTQMGPADNPWRTEIISPAGTAVGSAPTVVWNNALNGPYVFWRDGDGELKQSWLNRGYGQNFYDPPLAVAGGSPPLGRQVPRWQTITVAADAQAVAYGPRPTGPTPARPSIWPAAGVAYRIRAEKGNGPQDMLSSRSDGRAVELREDIDSGLQRWRFEQTSPGTYRITCAGNLPEGRSFLSCTPDGSVVDVWFGDDDSGRQKWTLSPNPHGSFTIMASGGVGERKYLSCNEDGSPINLATADDGSGRQRWHLTM